MQLGFENTPMIEGPRDSRIILLYNRGFNYGKISFKQRLGKVNDRSEYIWNCLPSSVYPMRYTLCQLGLIIVTWNVPRAVPCSI